MNTTLGDILRKVSLDIFVDLKTQLGEMKSQDAELRTAILKLFFARSKSKLIQCYAITKCLSNTGVVKNLQGIFDLQNYIGKIEDVLDQQLDEVYFSHALIYSMRSNHIEVSGLTEIMASSEYKSLPLSVFSCGVPETTNLRDSLTTLRDLDVYIRMKLMSDVSFPQHYFQYVFIHDGTLAISVPHCFSVHLTLRQLSIYASWFVLDFQNFSADKQSVPPLSSTSFKALDRGVLGILAEICVDRPVKMVDNKVTDTSRSTLARILIVCRYTSLAAGLRLLHRQALELSCSIWRGSLYVTFNELHQKAGACSRLSLHLWKSQFNREHQVTVCVTLHSAGSAQHLAQPLVIDFLTSASQFGMRLDADAYLQEGASLSSLLSDALSLLVVEKILHLAQRFRRSFGEMSAAICELYKVDLRRSSLVVSRMALDDAAGLVVEVDVRTGKYLLSSSGVALGADLLIAYQRDVELLASEINNVQSEHLFARYVTKDQSGTTTSASHDVPVRTLETVLRRLELHVWNMRATFLGVQAVNIPRIALGRSSAFSPRGCLVYQLDEWLSVGLERLRAEHGYALAFNPSGRITLKMDCGVDGGVTAGKKKRVSTTIAGRTIDVNSDDHLVRLLLLLVVAEDQTVSVHAVLSTPSFPFPIAPGRSFTPFAEEMACCLSNGFRCEDSDAEDAAFLFLSGAAKNAVSWAQDWLVHAVTRFNSRDAVFSEICGHTTPLMLVMRGERPFAVVLASSQQLCVSFLNEFNGLENLLVGEGVPVGFVGCLSGRALPSQLEGLFSNGGGGEHRGSIGQLRVSFDGFSPRALVDAVRLRPVPVTSEDVVDALHSIFEAYLRHVLQKVLTLSGVLNMSGLVRTLFDIQPLVQLLEYAHRVRDVVCDDNLHKVRMFLRPMGHCVLSSIVTVTLAVHRMERPSELDVVVGYVELSVSLSSGEGTVSGMVNVRDLATDAHAPSLSNEQTSVAVYNAETQLRSVISSMCK
jgi:hypothetical protein